MTTKIKSASLDTNIITTSHLHTNFSVDSDKIAANAIGPSELNQAANYTFTGTVTGAGSMVKLLNASSVSGATYDISSTYINATYDRYKIYYYIKHFEPYDKSGSYGIQGFSSIFVKSINGCFFNVVGLPVSRLFCYLKKFNLIQFS